jgi:hypothetical protein
MHHFPAPQSVDVQLDQPLSGAAARKGLKLHTGTKVNDFDRAIGCLFTD